MENISQRLFFALWPSEAVRDQLAETTETLKVIAPAHWVRPDKLHVTLAFLGNVESERLPLAKAAADQVFGQGFDLLLDRIEYWRKPQIICLSSSAMPNSLERLVMDLGANLKNEGFVLDRRPFRVHLTLARKAAFLPAEARMKRSIRWTASSFVLCETVADRQGANYVIRHTWSLG